MLAKWFLIGHKCSQIDPKCFSTGSACFGKNQFFCSNGRSILNLFQVKQDKFTTCFKTCGTGLLFWRVGRVCKIPLVPRLCRQASRQDCGSARCIKLILKTLLQDLCSTGNNCFHIKLSLQEKLALCFVFVYLFPFVEINIIIKES